MRYRNEECAAVPRRRPASSGVRRWSRSIAALLFGGVLGWSPPAFSQPAAGPIVWVTDGMQRVAPHGPPGRDRHIDIYAARGEYEPFQIVVRAPAGGLARVSLRWGGLRTRDGREIGAEHLTLYREHYVAIAQGSANWLRDQPSPPGAMRNEPDGPGIYAEPLIPFRDPETGHDLRGARLDAVPFRVAAGRNQPIWVDVFVPRDARPGAYHGRLRVTSAEGEAAVGVTLHVWNFELPRAPSLRSDFGFWNAKDEASAREMVRHRLMPREVKPEWLGRLVEQGLNGISLDFWSRLDLAACERGSPVPLPAPSVAKVRAAVRAHGGVPFKHAYFADEIDDCRSDATVAAAVRRFARRLQRGGATPLLTTYPFDEFWIDGPYIWALSPHGFTDPAGLDRARAHGQELWSYNAVYLDNYSPKWLLDYPAVNFRLQPGFISQSMGLTGLLYWAVDYWREGAEWAAPTAFGAAWPGEGVLTYPGSWVGVEGVVPGLRLKWIREGVEDFEYVELLKRRGEAGFALEQARLVGKSFAEWSRSAEAVYAVRRRLGERLHELSSE
ncbi:MAG TPA: hypothetical protein VFG47_13390 [Geminicoccaceae bacterium]|nr:hypothetical protein [Geminicoccaceae bacterium]